MKPAGVTDVDRERLIGCLHLFERAGSVGERDAAFGGALRIMRARGLDWADIIPPIYTAPCKSEPSGWRPDVEVCIRNLEKLTRWETDFVVSLRRFRRLSLKQTLVLREIAAKVHAETRAA